MTAAPCDCCESATWEHAFSLDGHDLGRCPTCGLYAVARPPSHERRLAELARGGFGNHGRVLGAQDKLAAERALEAHYRRYVELGLRFAPGGRWLDLGCGAGTLICLARERGLQVEGIELAFERLALARRLTGVKVHDRPLEELELEAGSFAAVTMIDVFSHLTTPAGTLRQVRRVLGPAGILLLHTSEIGPGAQPHHQVSWELGEHLFFLGEETIRWYAEAAGFDLIHRERVWMPEAIFNRERFRVRGRSAWRNLAKSACLHTPGALPLLRWYMLEHRHVGNPVFDATLVLRRQ